MMMHHIQKTNYKDNSLVKFKSLKTFWLQKKENSPAFDLYFSAFLLSKMRPYEQYKTCQSSISIYVHALTEIST